MDLLSILKEHGPDIWDEKIKLALEQRKRPVDFKPDVCWQVPIRFDVHTDDYEQDTVFVRAWERRDWGAAIWNHTGCWKRNWPN